MRNPNILTFAEMDWWHRPWISKRFITWRRNFGKGQFSKWSGLVTEIFNTWWTNSWIYSDGGCNPAAEPDDQKVVGSIPDGDGIFFISFVIFWNLDVPFLSDIPFNHLAGFKPRPPNALKRTPRPARRIKFNRDYQTFVHCSKQSRQLISAISS